MDYVTVPTMHYLVFLLVKLVVLTDAGVPRSSQGDVSKQESEELGLYDSKDKVRILTHINFNSEVSNLNHSILVQFYNSYCGHCRRFAPHYKQLAKNLHSWRDILPIAAINCAAEDNNDICREYEVMSYPTLRYFGPSYKISIGNYGKQIQSQDLNVITSNLAEFIAAENKSTEMPSWPDFQPVQSANTSSLFENLDSSKKYVILVYEPDNSTVGVEMILDFLRYREIAVKRITDFELAEKFKIDGTKYNIASIDRQGSIETHATQSEHPLFYKEAIKSFLNTQSIKEKPETQLKATTSKNLGDSPEDNVRIMKIIEEVKRNKHLVYQADLEMAIHKILYNEIPKSSNINGDKLKALNKFLEVLERYNPLDSPGRLIILKLVEFVSRHNQELSGKDFENELKKLEQQFGPLSKANHFIGCVASQAGLRGFTCSLWQLFHFMSVQAATSDKSQNPLEVLVAIHGYVKHFFGCQDCSVHFQTMAFKRSLWTTTTKDEAALWLWAAHNEVNQRLAGDTTEDPKFPKIQFPSPSSCAQCYKQPESSTAVNSEENWSKTHVLQFLKNIHNPKYISRYGMENDELMQPSLEKLRQIRMISNVFSDMDMRVGMLLYGFCIIMLVVAFKLFAFKGGYRKKSYGHDVLGKV